MVRARPRPHTPKDDAPVKITQKLRKRLSEFRDTQIPMESDRRWFTQRLIDEVKWAADQVSARARARTGPETRAEYNDWLKGLRGLEAKFRKPSHELLTALPVSLEPLEYADQLQAMIKTLEAAKPHVSSYKKLPGQADVSYELAHRVCRVLKDYGVSISTTYDLAENKGSPAIELLNDIGNSIGLPRSKGHWRDTIAKAKREPDPI